MDLSPETITAVIAVAGTIGTVGSEIIAHSRLNLMDGYNSDSQSSKLLQGGKSGANGKK